MAKKCEFRKKDGGRCGANAQAGTNSCIFHDPDKAAEGQRARRSGGISRSRPAAVLPLDVPDNHLRSTQDVARLLAGSINQVRRGQIDPRVANATGYLAGILLKALEQGRTEQRLAQLESILGCNKGCDGEIFNFVTQRSRLVKSHQHRLKTIELSLTPEQIVLVRHEAAKKAGSLVDAALISPAPRQAIANAGLQSKQIVYRMTEVLLAAEIALGRLNGCVPRCRRRVTQQQLRGGDGRT